MKASDQSRLPRDLFVWMHAARTTRWTKRQRRRPVLEWLEPRTLLATITEFPISSSTVLPTAITTGSDGNVWFIEQTGNAIGRIDATTHVINTFSSGLPASASLAQITSGPNGDLWFTESNPTVNAIGMFNPNNTGQPIQNFGSSAGMSANAGPIGITSADGDIWFTEALADKLAELNPTTGQITEFPAPAGMGAGFESQIVFGPDGYLWAAELGGIAIFNPANGSLVNQVPLPGGTSEQPFDLTVGPDGNIWYVAGNRNSAGTAYNSYAIGIVNKSSPYAVQEIPLPASTEPFGITTGPDSNIWVAVTSNGTTAGTIDQIDPATPAITQTLSIPTNVVTTPNPVAITAGPDGNVWFADAGGAIGVVNLNVQPHFVVTTPPAGVTAGQDFGMTVTGEYGAGIVDLLFNGTVTASVASVPTGGSSTVGGNFSVPAVKGVATFSTLTLDKAVAGYALQAASTGTGAPLAVTTGAFSVSAAAATKLVVTSEPTGPFSTGGGIDFTVAAEDPFNNVDPNFAGTVRVTLATNAGGAGTVLSGTTSLSISPASATPASVTFSGLSLNKPGDGYALGISSGSLSSTTTNLFNVTVAPPPPPPPAPPPPPPPPPPTIVSESVVLTQKVNKKTHKPTGKPTVSGYTITFSTGMDQTSLANGANYEIEVLKNIKTVTTKVGKRKIKTKVPVYASVGFTIPAADLTSNSVTMLLAGKQTFPKGGRIQVFAGGVDDTSGVSLAQTDILTISPKGNRIT